MPPAEFEPIISAGERPKTYALDRAATGTGTHVGILHANTHAGQQLRPLDITYIIYGDSFNVST